MYRPGESVLEEKEESTNDSLDELVEVELPDAEDVLDAAFESNEFLEHAVDFLPLAYCTDIAADMPTIMDTIGVAEQIAYFGSTEIIEATEVAPDTVVGHMMLGQIVSVTRRDLGHHVGTSRA